VTDDSEVTILESFDTDMIQREGWKLDKMFEDDKKNSMMVYNKAMEYAKKLSVQCQTGVRRVKHNESVFMEVYKKSSD